MPVCYRFSSAIFTLAVLATLAPTNSFGDAESYFDTHASIVSPASGGRFGAAIACSDGAATSDISHIAIGAPDAISNEGRVYIYSVADTPQLLETLEHPIEGSGFHFGASVAFIPDINSDGTEDLIIGESDGALHAFRSTGTPGFAWCSSVSNGAVGFGTVLHSARIFGSTPNSIIAGAPGESAVIPFQVVMNGQGPLAGCSFIQNGIRYGPPGFGASITEVAGDDDADSEVDTIVGAPFDSGNSGGVYLTGDNTVGIYAGSSSEEAGSAVAGHPSSNYFAFSRPKAQSGGNVLVRDTNLNAPEFECSVQRSGAGTAADFGKAMRHLGVASFINSSPVTIGAALAAYRSESSTGGSVAIFETDSGACSLEYQYNNCVADPNQEQGSILAGGGSCTGHLGGAVKSALLVGSPGYSSNTGRIDLVTTGSYHASPITCSGGGGGGGGGGSVPVSPGSSNLVAPTVSVAAKTATVTAPSVTPTLSDAQRKKYSKLLQKKLGLSKKKADQALDNLAVEYHFKVRVGLKSSAQEAGAGEISPLASSITRRSKRNTITLNRLSPGGATASYRVQIATKKPAFVLGLTKPSPQTRFTVQ